MQISRTAIRALVESVLLEGIEDDLRQNLLALHPELSSSEEFKKIPVRGLEWLVTRFGKRPSRKETHPVGDTLHTIAEYFEGNKDKSLETKYLAPAQTGRYNVFQDAVDRRFPPDSRAWKSPADTLNMTADDMETVLTLATGNKGKIVVNVSEEEMESDRVGKVGPWNLWMPSTRERSCAIAQFDPVTRQPKTTWCTARMAGSNLFYNYIGHPGSEMTLFYIIRDDPSETEHWLSLGFINGKPQLDGKDGMMSVDRDNKGLTSARYRAILGADHDRIMQILQAKSDSLGGVHPAREKIKMGARSLKGLRYLLQGLNDEEAKEMKRMVSHSEEASEEVLKFLSEDDDNMIKGAVAANKKTPESVLRELAENAPLSVKEAIAANEKTPGDVLSSFITSESLRSTIAFNPSTPEDTLIELYEDYRSYTEIKMALAKNVSTPRHILDALADYRFDGYIQAAAVLNPNTDPNTRRRVAAGGGSIVRHTLSYSGTTPPDVLEILSTDREERIRSNVAEHNNTPAEVLRKMAESDPSGEVRFYAKQNLDQKSKVVSEAWIRRFIRNVL